jgi:GT2 family glycosyltransferase
VFAFAGVLCVLTPVLVAIDAPGPVRLIAVLLLFSLAPGAAAVSVLQRREAEPKAEPGLVLGTSLALCTFLAWLMLWLHAWQPSAVLYALAGVCLALLVVGELSRSRRARGSSPAGGSALDSPTLDDESARRATAKPPDGPGARVAGLRRRSRPGPTWVTELELSAPIEDLRLPANGEREYVQARVLVRLHRQPLGFVTAPVSHGRLTAVDLQACVQEQLGNVHQQLGDAQEQLSNVHEQLGDVHERHLQGGEHRLRGDGSADATTNGPHTLASSFVSVVVCTRERASSLRATLQSLLAIRHESFEIIVVDNAPETTATRELVASLAAEHPIRYVQEPRPGLSRARNRGLAEARAEIVAFTDDDVIVDSEWLSAILRGFTRAEQVGCVTGLVPAAELDTEAQAYFDSKLDWAESCKPRLFDLREHRPADDRTYPYSAGLFGAGANFAIRKSVFVRVGKFDEALGVGSPSRGGEDLDYFLRVVLAGEIIAYEPAALVWHVHRRENDALVSQMYGYGTGLTAYVFKHLLFTPGVAIELMRRIPLSVAHFARDNNAARRSAPAPRGAMLSEARGLLAGPLLYALARRKLGSAAGAGSSGRGGGEANHA